MFDLKEITPQDTYIINLSSAFEMKQISYLIDLYQPIIGPEVMGFYFTLLNHLPLGQTGYSEPKLHRQLMSKMHISFSVIIKSRKVLEAIGLLKTIKYRNKEINESIFEYKLLLPLKPTAFFQSDVLSMLLLNRLGKSQFSALKDKFIKKEILKLDGFIIEKEITKSFDEVFDTILASELSISQDPEIQELLQPSAKVEEEEKSEVNVRNNSLDYNFIEGMAREVFKGPKTYTDKIKKILDELSFLYHISEVDIVSALKDPTIYTNSGKVDEAMLRQRLREKYRISQKEVLILNKETAAGKESIEEKDKKLMSKAERHQWILENYSPIELLDKYQNGAKIPEADLLIIEELLYNYKLPSGVVNVLIEYVMLTNDYKLPRKLTEKIAGHWKRLKINGVVDALEVAKKEHQIYKEWKQNPSKMNDTATKRPRRTNKDRKEKIPEYILNQDEKFHKENTSTENGGFKSDDEINQLLKALGEL